MFPHHLETPVLHFRFILALTMALMYERNQSRFRDPWSAIVRSFIIRLFNAPQIPLSFPPSTLPPTRPPSPKHPARIFQRIRYVLIASGKLLPYLEPQGDPFDLTSPIIELTVLSAQTNVDSSKLSVVIPNGQSRVKRRTGRRKRGLSVN